MSYRLAVTEKPSVAQSIAKVLGASKRCEGYLEGNGWLVSWCVGHLVELAEPEAYGERYRTWRYEDLPIFPDTWQYRVTEATKKQFRVLNTLMKREDVEELVECTDAGREGELIFRLVYHQCRCEKPFRRLWISSMEDLAIREGFARLRPSSEYDALYQAALCREHADWLVGINATRLFSCLYGQTLPVGRVMTPTLAMVVLRDAAIDAFQEKPFYTVTLQIDGVSAESERLEDIKEADHLKNRCEDEGQVKLIRLERHEKREQPPALYDLTSLQRDANRILGYTAQQTLHYTQSLYEKKLVTYPRTDSRYLTKDMEAKIPGLVQSVVNLYGMTAAQPEHIERLINDDKVSDHHAILPTDTIRQTELSGLPSGEQAVLRLIATRLAASVGRPYRFEESRMVFSCAGHEFTVKGKTVLEEGWKGIRMEPEEDGAGKAEKTPGTLPVLAEGQEFLIQQTEIREGTTTPPRHFTEDTLLSAMEHASAEDMPEEAERRGIGTPATRAATIEKLVQKGLMERRGKRKTKYLCATSKGMALVTVMPEQIQSSSMTADWEEKLLLVEKGTYAPERFMQEIMDMVATLVRTYQAAEDAETLLPFRKTAGICPHCGKDVIERKNGWFCENRDCRFALWKDNAFLNSIGKTMTKEIAETLLLSGKVRLKGCRSRKTGRTYDTTVILETEDDGTVKYRMGFGDSGKRGKSERRKK